MGWDGVMVIWPPMSCGVDVMGVEYERKARELYVKALTGKPLVTPTPPPDSNSGSQLHIQLITETSCQHMSCHGVLTVEPLILEQLSCRVVSCRVDVLLCPRPTP